MTTLIDKDGSEISTTSENPVKRKRAPRRTSAVSAPKEKLTRVIVKDSLPSAGTAIEVRKAPETIFVRNTAEVGEFSFLQLKAYNAMLHIAQKHRLENPDSLTYTVPISEFEKLVGHTTSHSREYLKDTARGLTRTQVEFDYRTAPKAKKNDWGIANLIAEVYIAESEQTITFSFPPQLSTRILEPEVYNRISIAMQHQFTSFSALKLWESVSRFWGSPTNETFHESWEFWSTLLSGSKTPHKEFRDFNKTLTRAVAQVNQIEKRFQTIPHLSKRNRKMDKLWFVLKENKQSAMDLNGEQAIVSDDLKKKLATFGLTDEEVEKLAFAHAEEYLLAQYDYTLRRSRQKSAEPIANPKNFYMSCVEGNYAKSTFTRQTKPAIGTEVKEDIPAAKPAAVNANAFLSNLQAQWETEKRAEILEMFNQQTPEKKKQIIDDLGEAFITSGAAFKLYQKNGFNNKIVQQTIADLVFQKEVPPPTPEQLLEFAFSKGQLSVS